MKINIKGLSIIISVILLISLAVILILITHISYKSFIKEEKSHLKTLYTKEVYEQYASLTILKADQFGFKIKNDGYISLVDLKVYEDGKRLFLNKTACRKICTNCSEDLTVLEVNATVICNVNLTPGNLLVAIARYAVDKRKIIGIIVRINLTIILINVTLTKPEEPIIIYLTGFSIDTNKPIINLISIENVSFLIYNPLLENLSEINISLKETVPLFISNITSLNVSTRLPIILYLEVFNETVFIDLNATIEFE